MLHDAQHTPAEFPQRQHYGHCPADYAVDLGRAAGVGTVVLFHHDPSRTDDDLDDLVTRLAAEVGADGPRVVAAREGQVLECGAPASLGTPPVAT